MVCMERSGTGRMGHPLPSYALPKIPIAVYARLPHHVCNRSRAIAPRYTGGDLSTVLVRLCCVARALEVDIINVCDNAIEALVRRGLAVVFSRTRRGKADLNVWYLFFLVVSVLGQWI